MQRDAVHRRRHGMLAHPVAHIPAEAITDGKRLGLRRIGEVRRSQVGRAAKRAGQHAVDHLEGVLRRLARRELRLFGRQLLLQRVDRPGIFSRQAHLLPPLELRPLAGLGRIEPLLPCGTRRSAASTGLTPGIDDLVRHHERRIGDAEILLRPGEFFSSERRAMHLGSAGLGGGAEPDGGARRDHRRLVGGLGLEQRLLDRFLIVAVHRDGVPADGPEPLVLVGRILVVELAVEGNVVVVPDQRQLVELQVPGERNRFLRDALHQAAVAAQHPGVVVDQLIAELGRQMRLGHRHTDAVGDALPEGSRGRLDARRKPVFRVARRLRVELPEILDLVDRHVLVAEEIERRIEQHRAMPGAQHETVAIGPMRIGRIELHHLGEQRHRHVGRAHRQAGMPRIGFFHRVHRKGTDRIGHVISGGLIGHRGLAGLHRDGRNGREFSPSKRRSKANWRHNRLP